MNSGEFFTNAIGNYGFTEYINDLLGMVICLNQDYVSQYPLLNFLEITEEKCKDKYLPLIKEVKENFRTTQSTAIGAPDKILIMLLEKIVSILKKFPKEMRIYLPAIIESFVNLIDHSLGHPESIDQSFTKAEGIDVKCLKTMFETIKSGEL